jgi:hypothetical protein
MQFWSVNVDPKYLNFATFDRIPTIIFILMVSRFLNFPKYRGQIPFSLSFQKMSLLGGQAAEGKGHS